MKGTEYFCTIENEEFYSANAIKQNNWNAYSSAESGTFGLGKESPIWNITGSPNTKLFDVYLTNFNGWTWAQSNYSATTLNSVINLNVYSSDYNSTTDKFTTVHPITGGSYLLPLESFGFGMTNLNDYTEYYETLLNADAEVYGNT